MYKYVVVGCGGSGGATLAYLMDQITSELTAAGISSIPAGLQFVHIDVPLVPDTNEPGVGNVRAQGGTYVGTAPQTPSYSVLDNAITGALIEGGALGDVATWAPRRAADVAVAVGNGAGQMRAVGRMLTLSHTTGVYRQLVGAVNALNTVEANTQMAALSRALPDAGGYDPAAPIVPIVVSSMAGGAGASMALDVCRLLSHVPQIDPNLISVFMLAPDVFDALPDHLRAGVLGNAIAMLGEIVAAQTGASEEHDRHLLGAFGQQLPPNGKAPFKRVFPVGRFAGTEHTQFGDGSPRAVYRGLGRALGALMLSGRASTDFVAYDLTNRPLPAKQSVFGWGTGVDDLAWGSFGFGSLSLGRDRYRHYAAQRLARTSVDRLLRGHLQSENASAADQLRGLVDSQWPLIAPAAGLPKQATPGVLTREELGTWMVELALPRAEVNSDVRGIIDTLVRPNLPQLSGGVAGWLGTVRGALSSQRVEMVGRTEQASYRWAFFWSQRLHEQVVKEVEAAAVRFGLPFAREVVNRIEDLIVNQVVPVLRDRSRVSAPDVGAVPSAFESEAGRIKGSVSTGQQLVDRLLAQISDGLGQLRYGRSSTFAVEALSAFVPEVLGPLRSSISDAIEILEQASVDLGGRGAGLANVETDRYASWPSDADGEVPDRFGVADNEVLLTPYTEFATTYKAHLPAAAGIRGVGDEAFYQATDAGARLVLSGSWPTDAGAEAPGGPVEVLQRWRPASFVRNPEKGGEQFQPSLARYVWHLRPDEVLDRAEAFVARPGESFSNYFSQTLAEYVGAADATPAQAAQRRTDLVDKFRQTVVRALPLISVDGDAVLAVHNSAIEYFFKFSSIPFDDAPALQDALLDLLKSMPNLDPQITAANGVFERALTKAAAAPVSRIDVFGSYRTYSPLAFDALLEPVARSWAATPEYARHAFWEHRRARPLAAALPMGKAERRALIGGWYVGQLTGRLTIPEAPYRQAVRVWNEDDAVWAPFPWPMLTPPSEFIGASYDWLPAVLESVLLAISRSHEAPVMSSMRPYQSLRRLWDDSPNGPALRVSDLNGGRLLGEWLSTGKTASGVPSRIVASTADERYAKAVEWVTAIRGFVGKEFLPEGEDGAPGGGEFAKIESRQKAGRTPMFRDLAPDIWAVTADLLDLLEVARSSKGRGDGSVPDPGLGTF